MSAFGQKQTFPRVRLMSALPPKADIVRHGGNVRFVPQVDSCIAAKTPVHSINSSASDKNDAGTVSQPERLSGCEIDDELKFAQPFDRKLARPSAPKNTADIETSMPISFLQTVAVAHQAASSDVLAHRINAWHPLTGRKADYLFAPAY
jgi:hypothetical protein